MSGFGTRRKSSRCASSKTLVYLDCACVFYVFGDACMWIMVTGVQEQLVAMEVGVEGAQNAFSQLDAQMRHSSQTATKIGDRLQVLPPLMLHVLG